MEDCAQIPFARTCYRHDPPCPQLSACSCLVFARGIIGGRTMKSSPTLRSVPIAARAPTCVNKPGAPIQVRIPPYACLRLASKGKRDREPAKGSARRSEASEGERARIRHRGKGGDSLTEMLGAN